MNFILANCRQGQNKLGIEKTPSIIFNKLNNNIFLSKSIKEFNFNSNKGYNFIYNYYNNYLKLNNYPIITLGGDHSVASASCQAFIDNYKEKSHIIWIDAHTDINTNITSETNNSHGMPVSKLMNLMNSPIDNKIYNLKPEQITYIGTRSIDKAEQNIIDNLNIKVYSTNDIYFNLKNVIKEINENINDKFIHISYDIDVIDPLYIKSTGTKIHHGINLEQNLELIKELTKNNLVISADFVELNLDLGNKKDQIQSLNIMVETIKQFIKYI
tara:strand:- start:4810 stop:5622 length:813 start_codon:yes stop_codon:yes gene_type:complete